MTVAPILTAEYVFRKALRDAFSPLLIAAGAPYLDTTGRAKCYWKRADQVDGNKAAVTPPYLIYQPQSNIAPLEWVGEIDAGALFLIKALAPSQTGAETLLGVAIPGVWGLALLGYTFSVKYEGSPPLPVVDDIWQAGYLFHISVSTA